MSAPRWFHRAPEQGVPAVTRLPCAPSWEGADWLVVATQRVIWAARGDRAVRVGIAGPWTGWAGPEGVHAWSAAGADLWAGPNGLDLNSDSRRRRGRDLEIAREPGGPWQIEGGPQLPVGARWSRTTRPWATGRGLAWSDSGFAYSWDLGAPPRVLGRGMELHFTPSGRPAPGPAPLVEPMELPELPGDAVQQPRRVAGLRTVAHRVEGALVRGWLRDGTEVVDASSPPDQSSTSGIS